MKLSLNSQQHRHLHKREQGQTLIIFTLSLVGLLLTLALVINAGLLYAARQALHNSVDLSTESAADYMEFNRNGYDASVFAAIYGIMNQNMSNANWTAYYVDNSGNIIYNGGTPIQVGESDMGNCNPSTGNCGNSTNAYPSNAVGVTMNASYPVSTFFDGLTKQTNISVGADSKTIVNRVGILSTSTWEWHSVYAASSGKFTVNGDIAVMSSSANKSTNYQPGGDSFDAKQGSAITINGYINTVSSIPLDGNCAVNAGQSPNAAPSMYYNSSTGLYTIPCYPPSYPTSIAFQGANIGLSTSNTTFNNQFAGMDNSPLPDSAFACGTNPVNYNGSQTIYGYTILSPGVYNGGGPGNPVVFDLSYGSIVLQDCGSNTPGYYKFPNGLIVTDSQPGGASSYELYGTDVMLYSEGHFSPPQAGTAPYPHSAISETNDYYPWVAGDLNTYDSFRFGGVNIGLIYLSAPASGTYKGLVLMGEKTVEGNISFDTYYQDNATIVINGSISTTWANAPGPGSFSYWAGEGNAIQSGYNNWSTCDPASTPCPDQSQGNVTINGLAAADFFQTAGKTDVTVNAPTVRLWQLN